MVALWSRTGISSAQPSVSFTSNAACDNASYVYRVCILRYGIPSNRDFAMYPSGILTVVLKMRGLRDKFSPPDADAHWIEMPLELNTRAWPY